MAGKKTRHRADPATCNSPGRVTAGLLFSFLALSPATFLPHVGASRSDGYSNSPQLPLIPPQVPVPHPEIPGDLEAEHDFTLRHVFHHGAYLYPQLHRRLDIEPETPLWVESKEENVWEPATKLHTRSRPMTIQRLRDRRPDTVESLLAYARHWGAAASLVDVAWTLDELAGPNVTDKETVLSFAKMASNAYKNEPDTVEWEDIGSYFNRSADFGWEGDGIRGHVFADPTNSTIVMSLKGTTMAVFDGAETTTNDKINDNLFASCCCADGGGWGFWKKVCDCCTGTYACNQTCLGTALREESRYYRASLDLYSNVTALYPNSAVWLVGHSLGGVMASLLGLTYGLPTLTFEAYGDALAASRLGIPPPPGSHGEGPQHRRYTGTYHIGHTADPVFMGSCNGATASCSMAGYAMESTCHTGLQCVYDVVKDKGWRVGIGTHRIKDVIHTVIEEYDEVPECVPEDPECQDCYSWNFFESNGTDRTTTSSTTTSTQTRTSTCKTPGWWGCNDPTTTSTSTSSVRTSTTTIATTTATCSSYGWFGHCLDPTTSSTSHSISSTGTVPRTTAFTSVKSTSSSPPVTSSLSECETPGYFWGCRDRTSTSLRPDLAA